MVTLLGRRVVPLVARPCIRGIRSTNQLPYTKEQQCQVLDVLNQSSEQQLSKLLSPACALRIMHERKKTGAFGSLDSVFSVNGLRSNTLLKFCESVIYKDKQPNIQPKGQPLIPAISTERALSLKKVASIKISLPNVLYAVMDKNREVLELRQFVAADRNFRTSLSGLYEVATLIYTKVYGKADIYIFQQPTTNQAQVNASRVNKKMLESMLFTMLNFGEPDQPKVVQMKPQAVGRMFSLKIGSEEVACEKALWKCVNDNEINVHPAIVQQLHRADPSVRESFGRAVLECLTTLRILKQ